MTRRKLLMTAFAVPLGARELPDALDRFAASYNAFIRELARGVFDVHQARELSRAWAAIERSDEWPR